MSYSSVQSSRAVVLLACIASLIASSVFADGPPRHKPRQIEAGTEYSHTALDAYGEGYAFIERATRFDQDASAAENERDRQTAIAGSTQAYEDALGAVAEAVRIDPRMYEAHTYIGYANRKLGRHERALDAYAAALKLKPDYVRAIEYQGEAYLGLDRFADAKFNYQRLYALDSEQAEKLLAAMRKWLEERKADAHSVPPDQIAAASAWLNDQPHMPAEKIATEGTPW